MGKNGQFNTVNILHQIYFLISKLAKHNIFLHWNELNLTFLDQTSLASPKLCFVCGPWRAQGWEATLFLQNCQCKTLCDIKKEPYLTSLHQTVNFYQWCQIVRFYPWCQIVRGVKLSVFTHGVKLSGVKLSVVSNCPRCQIVCGVKLSAVSNCPGVKLSYNPKRKAMKDKLFLCQPFSLVGHQRGTIEKKETTLECSVWTKIMILYIYFIYIYILYM